MKNEKGQPVVHVGLDVSYNSTGLVIFDTELLTRYYFRITSDNIKIDDQCPDVVYIKYDRHPISKIFGVKEINKIKDALELSRVIRAVLTKYRKVICDKHECPSIFYDIRIEGNVMGQFGRRGGRQINSHGDMYNVTAIVKAQLVDWQDSSLWPVAILAIKSYFAKNGRAKKEDMIKAFWEKEPNFISRGKIDDIVDAYAVATHVEPWDRDKHDWHAKILAERSRTMKD